MRIAGRHSRRWIPPSATHVVGSALLIFALLFQNYVAERHFHPIGISTGSSQFAQISRDGLNKPFAPTSDQQDDECPLCQVLGLGASLDVTHAITLAVPVLSAVLLGIAWNHVQRPVVLLSEHRPRGPPASFSLA